MNARYSRQAADDLVALADRISDRDTQAAVRFIRDIEAAKDRIGQFPFSARQREEPGFEQVRSVSVGPWLLLYHVVSDAAVIVRIVHGARKLDEVLADIDFRGG